MTDDYRWNNFHLWFPEGFYRPNAKNERAQKIITDLDSVLEEQNFDLQEFQELMKSVLDISYEGTQIFKASNEDGERKLKPEEKQRIDELKKLESANYTKLDSLLEPVVKRMQELGYSLEELTK